MTTPDTAQLRAALAAYANDHGLAAADALVIESATDRDLTKLAKPLIFYESGKRRKGMGDETTVTIVRAVGALLNLYEHVEPWPGAVEIYGGSDDADSTE